MLALVLKFQTVFKFQMSVLCEFLLSPNLEFYHVVRFFCVRMPLVQIQGRRGRVGEGVISSTTGCQVYFPSLYFFCFYIQVNIISHNPQLKDLFNHRIKNKRSLVAHHQRTPRAYLFSCCQTRCLRRRQTLPNPPLISVEEAYTRPRTSFVRKI